MKKVLFTLLLFTGLASQAQWNLELAPGYNWAKVEVSAGGQDLGDISADVSSLQLGLHYDFVKGPTMASLGARGYMFGVIEGGSTVVGGAEIKLGLDAIHAIGGIDTDGGFIYGIGGDIPLGESKFALAPSIRFQSESASAGGYDVSAAGTFVGLGVNFQF